jgi:hypothetical protein
LLNAVDEIVAVLEPLEHADRLRALQAAFILLWASGAAEHIEKIELSNLPVLLRSDTQSLAVVETSRGLIPR